MKRNSSIRLRRWSASISVGQFGDGLIREFIMPAPASEWDLQRDQMAVARGVASHFVGELHGVDVVVQLYKATQQGVREDQRAYGYVDQSRVVWTR